MENVRRIQRIGMDLKFCQYPLNKGYWQVEMAEKSIQQREVTMNV